MEIRFSFLHKTKGKIEAIYRDVDSDADLVGKKVSGARAYCFYGENLVIVYSPKKGEWTPPGGGIEEDETYEEGIIREIREESNMRVLKHAPIGILEVAFPEGISYYTFSVTLVEPIGEFTSDPDGDISEIKLIDPSEIESYIGHYETTDRVLARALEIKEKWQTDEEKKS